MARYAKIGKDLYGEIVKAYVDDLKPIIEIASWFHVSRQAIYKVLKAEGVDTSKRKYPVKCSYCGKTLLKTKGKIRGQERHFCNHEHYYLYLEVLGGPSKFNPNRHGLRMAREKVGRFFDLQNGNVVHHEDKDNLNNLYNNLRVFASQGDHVRYHRGVDKPEPIWDGNKLPEDVRWT